MSGRDIGGSVRQRLLNRPAHKAGCFRDYFNISRWNDFRIASQNLHIQTASS